MEKLIRQEEIPEIELPPKTFYFCKARDFEELADRIHPESKTFGLFIAADARGTSDEVILNCAERLVDKGLAYLCAWGPDCERVHDLFDRPIFRHDEATEDVIMTTWHERDSLPKAIFFFVFSAVPTSSHIKSCTDWIAVSIGNSTWSNEIRERIVKEVNSHP